MHNNKDMKKIVVLLVVLAAMAFQVKAVKHTVTISGTSYSPALLSAHTGDTVTISASNFHPLVQVGKDTWNNNGVTPLTGGWGTKTANYTFTVGSADTIYYVCSAHVSFGMKGKVVIAPSSGINDFPTDHFSVSVYPNPVTSTGTVRISSDGPGAVSVRIFNISGSLERNLSSASTHLNGIDFYQFDAGSLPAGNHFILVSNNRNKIVARFEVIR